MSRYKNLAAIGLATMLSFGLVACGGGGGDTPPPPPVEEPTAYEKAVDAIQAANTDAAAQKAVDDAAANVSGAQLRDLQAKADDRKAALATAASAAQQKMALMDAANMIDTSDLMTAEAVAAANTAIAALKAALAAATDVSDADKAMYQGRVTAAETAVAAAQSALDHAAQMMALSHAVDALQAMDLSSLSTQEAIDAAEAAIGSLRAALNNATELSAAEKAVAMTELAAANRIVMAAQGNVNEEDQKMVLSDAVAALGAIDLDDLMTQAQIDDARAAIIVLDLALEAATDLTDAEKLDATVDVTVAKRKVSDAVTVLNENIGTQRTALMAAAAGLDGIDLDDLDTAEKITAANEAVEKLEMALAAATHLSDVAKAMYQTQLETATETVRVAQTGMDRDSRMTAQRMKITNAVTMARTAVEGVDDDATDAQVTAADDAVAVLEEAIDEAVDLGESDTDVAMAKGTLATLKGQLASAKTSRTAAMDEKKTDDDNTMLEMAAKLYKAIGMTPLANNDGTGTALDDDGVLSVLRVVDPAITAVALAENKQASIMSLKGWEGSQHTKKEDDDGTYTAVVYANVGEGTEGAKFNSGTGDGGVGFATTEGVLTIAAETNVAARIASPSFDHTSGNKPFKLPDPNPGDAVTKVLISGSYYGVAGTYACTPGGTDGTCEVARSGSGYVLSTGGDDAWTFTATNPEARVMDTPDDVYAAYGWWLHEAASDGAATVSAFTAHRGAVDEVVALNNGGGADGTGRLSGTATYMGGAAGKYALSSATGGDNDSGHFVADAKLMATFGTTAASMIEGSITNFKVGDNMASRDWSVALKVIKDEGATDNFTDGGAFSGSKTAWTIGGKAAADSGEWSGQLYDEMNHVPTVATGTFHSTYGNDGRMVGAFGVTKDDN